MHIRISVPQTFIQPNEHKCFGHMRAEEEKALISLNDALIRKAAAFTLTGESQVSEQHHHYKNEVILQLKSLIGVNYFKMSMCSLTSVPM